MDVFHPKMLTRIALIYLEEAVLDVLFKAREEKKLLKPDQISPLIGIASSYKKDGDANPIVHGILNGLKSRGLVQQKSRMARGVLQLRALKLNLLNTTQISDNGAYRIFPVHSRG